MDWSLFIYATFPFFLTIINRKNKEKLIKRMDWMLFIYASSPFSWLLLIKKMLFISKNHTTLVIVLGLPSWLNILSTQPRQLYISQVWAAILDPFFSATSFGAVLSYLLLLSLSVDSSFLVAKLTTALNLMKFSF